MGGTAINASVNRSSDARRKLAGCALIGWTRQESAQWLSPGVRKGPGDSEEITTLSKESDNARWFTRRTPGPGRPASTGPGRGMPAGPSSTRSRPTGPRRRVRHALRALAHSVGESHPLAGALRDGASEHALP